ncbi:prepilin-type N-terminal cleavage/methylation domain-containing protein [Paraglaciecola aquimarina]|uniref:Prepilin-type N-terminal cleavage/methylation domain-containing protein n=1 Tax=Paraglaciecola algarum TaxID=3050085 RepID=A0ABS9D6D4_9ALTE|nr:prepilin-type N-terminal cleavage/methylation domain-containing protein [Paraglaciecola sp. G1-23]
MNNQSPQLLRKRQQGIGMIEVLVTLFILSVGLLGVAYLQLVGSFTNSEALSRSQSVLVAQQITERLRANAVFSPIGDGLVVHNDYFTPGIYNFTGLSCTSGLPHTCYCLSLPATIPDCNTNTCSAAEIAAFDGYEASCAAVAANPKIKIQVSCADNNLADIHACSVGSKLDVTLTWPVQKWQDIQRTLNPNCNVGKSSPHDCVSVELTL